MAIQRSFTKNRASFLSFARPDFGDEEIVAVQEVIRSGWVTTGPRVQEFESAFADYLGAGHAVAVNSGTAALHLALEAAGVGRGDVVVTTPYTFAATAAVARYLDAVPVFADVETDTLNIDCDRLELVLGDLRRVVSEGRTPETPSVARVVDVVGRRALNRVVAIVPVHFAGHPCDLPGIYALARRYGLVVVEDAAHAIPCVYGSTTIGGPAADASGLTRMVCFSFYATKTMTTGEGGMLVTEDADLAQRCRIMSLHGISNDAWKRYEKDGSWRYDILAPGYKYNMTDIAAAMGLTQLRKVEAMWRRRCTIAARYTAVFREYPDLQVPCARRSVRHSWHLYPLRLDLARLRIDRFQFVEALRARNIGTSVHFIPLHLHSYYRDTYGYSPDDFPVASREYAREVSLPIYSAMQDSDVDHVIDAVLDVVEQARV